MPRGTARDSDGLQNICGIRFVNKVYSRRVMISYRGLPGAGSQNNVNKVYMQTKFTQDAIFTMNGKAAQT